MAPIFVGFHAGPGYAGEARELVRTLEAFGLDHDVRQLPDLGDWTRNCAMKPAFIRDRMLQYPGRPIVWLDADARVRRRPVLFEQLDGVDFAAHWRGGCELLSGTMYFGPTPASRALVVAWCEHQLRTPDVWDQRVLQRVIESGAVEGLVTRKLPAAYTAIFDAGMCPEEDRVISHHQASRRLKDRS